MTRPAVGRDALRIVVLAVTYFAVARLSLSLAVEPAGIAAVWPPAGIFLAALLLSRRRLRPWVAAALLVAGFVAEYSAGAPRAVSGLFALARTGDAVLGAWLLHRFVGEPFDFRRLRDAGGWLALSVALSNAVMSLVAAAATQLLPDAPSFWRAWWWWSITTGMGNLLATPVIMSWAAWIRTRVRGWTEGWQENAELGVICLLLSLASVALFSQLTEHHLFGLLLTAMSVPFLLWAALRLGLRGASTVLIGLAAVAVSFASSRGVPALNVAEGLVDDVLAVQMHLAAMSIMMLCLAVILTERGQIDAAVRESAENFRTFFEGSSIGKSLTGIDGSVQVNQAFADMLGYTPAELSHRTWQSLSHPDDEAETQRSIAPLLAGTSDAVRFTKRYLHRSGAAVWADVSTTLRRDAAGQPLHFLTTVVDITERRRAEDAERSSRALLQSITDNATSLIYALDADGRFLLINRSLERVLGVPRETLIGKSREAALPPAVAAGHRRNDLQVLEERRSLTFEEETTQTDGRHNYLSVKFPLFDADGCITGIGGVSTDVTDRVRTEEQERRWVAELRESQQMLLSVVEDQQAAQATKEELLRGADASRRTLLSVIEDQRRAEVQIRQLNAQLEERVRERTAALEEVNEELRTAAQYARTLLETSLDPLVTIDAVGTITDLNAAFVRATGRPRDQVVGTEFADYMTEPEHARDAYRQAFARGVVTDYPLTIRHADGRLTDVLYNASVYRDSRDEVQGIFAAARDISEIKRAQERTAQLNAHLEAANRELEAFSYSVSHDLRAPLRGIDGFSRIMLEDYAPQLDDEGRDNIARIRAATQHMAQLIDDLLNLARISRTAPQREAVDVSAMVREIIAALRAQAPERSVTVVVAEAVNAIGDPRLLRVVLENLVANAWKFTGPRTDARIEFGAVRRDGQSHMFVRDNGVGFDARYADKLFGAFQRLHSSAEFPGTGIGLATVQRIVQRHGGRVWAEGDVDKGATFWLTLTTTT